MNRTTKKPPLPRFETDEEAEKFINEADLSQYDLSGKAVRFEFEEKTKQINMRMSENLIDAIKKAAKSRGMPYQRFIREAVEKALHNNT